MQKKLNILFVHEVNYLTKPIFEMHEFPELLALRGHKVSFIQFAEGYKFWQSKRSPQSRVINGRVHSDAKLQLLTPFQLGLPGFDRILAIFTFFPLLKKVLSSQPVDVIINYAVPTFGVQTNALAKRYKKPVVFRALDVSHKIRKSIFGPLIKAAEKSVYRNATLISANNPGLAKYSQTLGASAARAVTNLPPLDLAHFKKTSADATLAISLGIDQGDRVIVYMGSFFYFSGLAQVIQAFAKTRPQKTKLLLIGGGEQDLELRQLVEKLGLSETVLFTGFIDYARLPEYFSIAHVAINPMEPGLVSNTAFPHKVLQYVAGGLPVVSTKLDGLKATFADAAGITWADSPESVFEKAVELIADSTAINSASTAQTIFCNRVFGIEAALNDFEHTLQESMRIAK
jgi:glycosyltransferase involved in cell wall biosynthesis